MIEDLVAQLEQIGSPGGIAEMFRNHGIVGRRNTSRYCPVAQYLRKKSNNPVVSVSVKRVGYMVPDTNDFKYIPTSENVHAFIANFDMGIYPYLIED